MMRAIASAHELEDHSRARVEARGRAAVANACCGRARMQDPTARSAPALLAPRPRKTRRTRARRVLFDYESACAHRHVGYMEKHAERGLIGAPPGYSDTRGGRSRRRSPTPVLGDPFDESRSPSASSNAAADLATGASPIRRAYVRFRNAFVIRRRTSAARSPRGRRRRLGVVETAVLGELRPSGRSS